MFADLSLVFRALKYVIEDSLKPAVKREFDSYLTTQCTISIRQACRTVYYYQPNAQRDEQLIHMLEERYPQCGFKKFFQLLRQQGNA